VQGTGYQSSDNGQQTCCLLAVALDVLRVPMIIHDRERILYTNAATRAILHVASDDDLEGTPLSRFVPPEMDEVSRARRDLILDRDQQLRAVPIKIRAANGDQFWAETDGRKIVYDGDRSAIVQTTRSVNGRPVAPIVGKIPGSATRPIAERCGCIHQAGAEAVLVPILLHDREVIVFANAAARYLLGQGEQLEGRPVSELFHPDSTEATSEHRRLIFDHGQTLCGVPIKMRSRDGRTIGVAADALCISFHGMQAAMLSATDARECA